MHVLMSSEITLLKRKRCIFLKKVIYSFILLEYTLTIETQTGETTMSNYNPLADAYAQLDAEYKLMKARVEDLRNQIIAAGEGDLVGEYYTVTYKKSKPVGRFDKDLASAQMAEFGLTAAQIQTVLDCKSAGEQQNRLTVKATAMSLSSVA
jgi:hypothetical protein